jgi:hypothetical protein
MKRSRRSNRERSGGTRTGLRRLAAVSISPRVTNIVMTQATRKMKLPLVLTDVALTPPLEHSPKPCLR